MSRLPPKTAVLYLSINMDNTGKYYIPRDVIPLLRKATNAPIFGVSDTYLGYGIVGGNLVSYYDISQNAAEMALDILGGRNPSDIPAKIIKNKNCFDWLEMKYWGVKESILPQGSAIVNKNFSAWKVYRWQIIGVFVFLLIEANLIFFLLFQLSWRKKVEAALKESENKYRSLYAAVGDPFFLVDRETGEFWMQTRLHTGYMGMAGMKC